MDLRHAHIQVKNMEKSRSFYENNFGFKEDFVCDADEIFIKNEKGFVLGLNRMDQPDILPKWFHFGFSCSSKEEIESIFKKFKSSNYDIKRELTIYENGDMNFYVNDPDGTSIEVYYNI